MRKIFGTTLTLLCIGGIHYYVIRFCMLYG